MKRRAFTLIELLVVISIVALLSSVVLASLNTAREKGRIAGAQSFATQIDHMAGDYAVGLWNLDEGSGTIVADRSGFGRNGAIGTGASFVSDTPWGKGNAVLFDGTANAYVNVSDPSGAFSFADTSPFTVSFWIKFKSFSSTSYVRMISKEMNSGGRQGWDVLWNYPGQNISFERWRDGAANIAGGLTVPALDTWYQIVVTYDGTTMKSYRDGKLYGSTSSSLQLVSHNWPLTFGAYSWGSGSNSNTAMDDIRIYDKALTAAEIGSLYAASFPSHIAESK